ncbi:hypothetical protein [Aurantivibrio plasticivorans]
MPKLCIFCEKEGKLSREHLWPDWLGKMYIRKGDEKHTFGAKTYANKALKNDGVYERPGHLFSLKIRAVCSKCNNGWMSGIENKTKPIILKMIEGKKCKISKEELEALSFWVALKVVVAEHANNKEDLSVTPSSDRRLMMEDKKIPNYLNIFIGNHSTGHNSAWLRYSWTMAYSPNGPSPPLLGHQRNAQAISFMVGPIFFYVLQVRVLGFSPERHFNFGPLLRIWPSKKNFLRWPPKRPLRKRETDIIGYMAQDFTEGKNTRYIPEMPS